MIECNKIPANVAEGISFLDIDGRLSINHRAKDFHGGVGRGSVLSYLRLLNETGGGLDGTAFPMNTGGRSTMTGRRLAMLLP